MSTSRRIRVAYCLDSFAIGGTELNAVRTAEALDPNRFELYVQHLKPDGPLRARYVQLGIPMAHLPIQNLYSLQTMSQGMRLAKLLQRWKVDIVHTHDLYSNIFAVPWARLCGRCSVIASRRWWKMVPRPGLLTLNRLSYSLADCVLANSNGVSRMLAREEKVPPDKIVEIPNFLEEQAFETLDEALRLAQRRAWGVPDGVFVIGMVARLAPVKNHALLLRAAALLDSRFHFLLIGDGPSRTELEGLVQQLRIESRVHFAGEVISARNLHQFFDVSVLCSLSEGFPNSVIEAMAAGKPLVATPVGGVPDVVTDGVTGILVPVDDPAPLAGVLRMLEGDPLLRIRFGETGREKVRRKYCQNLVIERLSALYESVADRHHAASREFIDG